MSLPVHALSLLVAASSLAAQTSRSASELGRPLSFEISLSPHVGSVLRPLAGYDALGAPVYLADQNGLGLDARFHLPTFFYLSAGVAAYDDVQIAKAGLGFAISAGNGRVNLAYEEAFVDVDGIDSYLQARFLAGYEHNFRNGVRIGFHVHHIISSTDFTVDFESVTAPVFTAGYRFDGGQTIDLSVSGEDFLLGSPDAGRTFRLGFGFPF